MWKREREREIVKADLEELSGEDDDRSGSVTDFLILHLGKIDKDLGSGVLNIETLEDRGTVVGDQDVSNLVDEHLVETLRAERALNDVCDGRDGDDVLRAHILAGLSGARDDEFRKTLHG